MLKMFRKKDAEVKCKTCGKEVCIGYNVKQQQSFERFRDEMIEKSQCPRCLINSRLDNMIDYDKVLVETAVNMIKLGVFS